MSGQVSSPTFTLRACSHTSCHQSQLCCAAWLRPGPGFLSAAIGERWSQLGRAPHSVRGGGCSARPLDIHMAMAAPIGDIPIDIYTDSCCCVATDSVMALSSSSGLGPHCGSRWQSWLSVHSRLLSSTLEPPVTSLFIMLKLLHSLLFLSHLTTTYSNTVVARAAG